MPVPASVVNVWNCVGMCVAEAQKKEKSIYLLVRFLGTAVRKVKGTQYGSRPTFAHCYRRKLLRTASLNKRNTCEGNFWGIRLENFLGIRQTNESTVSIQPNRCLQPDWPVRCWPQRRPGERVAHRLAAKTSKKIHRRRVKNRVVWY